jgi:hypothetical protein
VPDPTHRTYPTQRVYAIVAGANLLAAIVLWYFALHPIHTIDVPPLTMWADAALMVLAFIGSETLPLRVELKRETFLVSLSELPAVYGLLVLPAWVVGLSHVVAGLLVYLFRHDTWRSIRLNLAIVAAESGVAGVIATRLDFGWSPGHSHPIFGAAAGGIVAALASNLAVPTSQ